MTQDSIFNNNSNFEFSVNLGAYTYTSIDAHALLKNPKLNFTLAGVFSFDYEKNKNTLRISYDDVVYEVDASSGKNLLVTSCKGKIINILAEDKYFLYAIKIIADRDGDFHKNFDAFINDNNVSHLKRFPASNKLFELSTINKIPVVQRPLFNLEIAQFEFHKQAFYCLKKDVVYFNKDGTKFLVVPHAFSSWTKKELASLISTPNHYQVFQRKDFSSEEAYLNAINECLASKEILSMCSPAEGVTYLLFKS